MVFVQKWPSFQLFFLGNIGQENVFYDILERKNAFWKKALFSNLKLVSNVLDMRVRFDFGRLVLKWFLKA